MSVNVLKNNLFELTISVGEIDDSWGVWLFFQCDSAYSFSFCYWFNYLIKLVTIRFIVYW